MSMSTLPHAPRLSAALDAARITDSIVDEIVAGEHSYTEGDFDRGVLTAIVRGNVDALLSTLDGHPLDLRPARDAGRLKAEAGIPLVGVLHAYRLAGLRLWRELDRVLLEHDPDERRLFTVGEQVWSMLDQMSIAAAEAHRAVTDARERWDEQARVAALTDVFDGVPSPERITQAAHVLRVSEPGRFLVVAADTRGENAWPAGGTSRAHWLDCGSHRVGLLAGIDAAQATPIAESLGVRVGVSRPFTMLHEASEALRQATVAMRCVSTAAPAVVHYGSTPIQALVVAQPRAALELAHDVFGALSEVGETERSVLIDTFEAWVAHRGSNAAAAAALHCHRNTVLYRLKKLESRTGRELADPSDAAVLTFAMYADRLL